MVGFLLRFRCPCPKVSKYSGAPQPPQQKWRLQQMTPRMPTKIAFMTSLRVPFETSRHTTSSWLQETSTRSLAQTGLALRRSLDPLAVAPQTITLPGYLRSVPSLAFRQSVHGSAAQTFGAGLGFQTTAERSRSLTTSSRAVVKTSSPTECLEELSVLRTPTTDWSLPKSASTCARPSDV